MAKYTPGPTVASVSGSIGGTVYSRNRYGQYMRFRAKPVVSTTDYANVAKANFAAAAEGWPSLTAAQRAAWETWAQTNPVPNSLGIPQVLAGNAAYVQLNARLIRAGDTVISVPPLAEAPAALLTLVADGDIGAGDVDLTFTATPLAATERLWVWAAVVDNPSRNYVRNLLKLIAITAAAQASPYDYETAIVTRFGTLQVGQKIVIEAQVQSTASGLLSTRRQSSVIVTTT